MTSCSPQPVAYAVALVDTVVGGGEAFTAAEQLAVMAESEIANAYRVVSVGRVREGTDLRQLPTLQRWRVRVFATADEAATFAAGYLALAATYGYADRNGLPVRDAPSSTATIVYRLREAEVTKIIGRGAEQEAVGEYQNYWYEILTRSGTSGFTFGEFLPVFESTGDPEADVARLRNADPLLERVLATTWRPEYFRDMVASGRLDLRRMRSDIGLFPRPAQKTIELRLDDVDLNFRYEDLERRGERLYILRGATVTTGGDPLAGRSAARDVGADPRLTVLSGARLSLSYTTDGRLVTPVFVDLALPLSELVTAERARRDLLYADLLRRAARLSSNAYGTIQLGGDRTFQWSGGHALQPTLLPPGAAPLGQVDYRYHLAASLRDQFDGVLTFTFSHPDRAASSARELNALYAYDPAGLRLVVAGAPAEDLTIASASRSALVIYFAFDPS